MKINPLLLNNFSQDVERGLHDLPVATETNYCKRDALKQNGFILSKFWKLNNLHQITQVESGPMYFLGE